MVTVGRVFFAAVQRWVPSRAAYHLLPFVLAGAFVLVSLLSDGDTALGLVAFGLAGFGCSALLPLTISFGQEELTAVAAGVAGGVIAFYQVGYGLAAFGTGPLLDHGVGLPTIFKLAAAVAVCLGVWSFAVARRRPSPASLHPHLASPA
jgi:predicted MFS family arabinose efflux permease